MPSVRNEYAEPPNDTVLSIYTPWIDVPWPFDHGKQEYRQRINSLSGLKGMQRGEGNQIGRLIMTQNEPVVFAKFLEVEFHSKQVRSIFTRVDTENTGRKERDVSICYCDIRSFSFK